MKPKKALLRWALPIVLGSMLSSCSASLLKPSDGTVHDAAFRKSVSPTTARGNAMFASAEIDGSKGGQVKVGNWKVTVPKGAYVGTGTITVVVDSTTDAICDLTISPESLNNFRIPVNLKYKVKLPTQIRTSQMYWWDPADNVWREIPTSPDYLELGVQTDLWHFSRYGCDSKAGW